MNIENTKAPNTTETAIGFIPCYRLPFLSLFHADCMEIMKQYPDKYFDLAIVDPPYGLERFKKANEETAGVYAKRGSWKHDGEKNWNNEKPSKEYWNELFRVSKNQIIWGANNFELPNYIKGYMIYNEKTARYFKDEDNKLEKDFQSEMRMLKVLQENEQIMKNSKVDYSKLGERFF